LKIKSVIFDNDNTLYRVPKELYEAVINNMDKLIADYLNISKEKASIERKNCYAFNNCRSTGYGFYLKYGFNVKKFNERTYLNIAFNRYLKKDYKLVKLLENISQRKIILTNNPKVFAEKIVSVLGIKKFFNEIFGEEDYNFNLKPKLEPYHVSLNFLKEPSENILMVEDTLENLLTAKKLGIKTALITNKKIDNVDFCLKDIYELEEFL